MFASYDNTKTGKYAQLSEGLLTEKIKAYGCWESKNSSRIANCSGLSYIPYVILVYSF